VTTKELLGWAGRLLVIVRRPFNRDERVVFSTHDEVRVATTESGVRVEAVPKGTRLVIQHWMKDGTETRIEIER